MIPLDVLFRLVYCFNILVLAPVCWSLFFGYKVNGLAAFNYKVSDSAGLRFLVASFWLGILLISILGLFFPFQFWPIIFFQVVYKLIYLLTFILPLAIKRDFDNIPWGVTLIFFFIVCSYPIVLLMYFYT